MALLRAALRQMSSESSDYATLHACDRRAGNTPSVHFDSSDIQGGGKWTKFPEAAMLSDVGWHTLACMWPYHR